MRTETDLPIFDFVPVNIPENGRLIELTRFRITLSKDLSSETIDEFLENLCRENEFEPLYREKHEDAFTAKLIDVELCGNMAIRGMGNELTVTPKFNTDIGTPFRFYIMVLDHWDERAELHVERSR